MPEGVIGATSRMPNRLFVAVCFFLTFATLARAGNKSFSETVDPRPAARSHAVGPDSQFAMGDFDGDRQLDFVSVEMARFNSQHSRYSVSFRLSKGGPQTIGVTGPAGGLAMVAQDVNGDHVLDVVLVTPWRHELVAVLLNDGHGHFSSAAPHQFRIDAIVPGSSVGRARQVREDRAALSVPFSPIADSGRAIFRVQQSHPQYRPVRPPIVASFSSRLCGRAPPANVFLHV